MTRQFPHQYPAGIGTVIVNGTVVLDGGGHTGALPGRLLGGGGRCWRDAVMRFPVWGGGAGARRQSSFLVSNSQTVATGGRSR